MNETRIRFKVSFKDGRVTFVEYTFCGWDRPFFYMDHYSADGAKIDGKAVANISARKAMKNLLRNGRANGATIRITMRTQCA